MGTRSFIPLPCFSAYLREGLQPLQHREASSLESECTVLSRVFHVLGTLRGCHSLCIATESRSEALEAHVFSFDVHTFVTTLRKLELFHGEDSTKVTIVEAAW